MAVAFSAIAVAVVCTSSEPATGITTATPATVSGRLFGPTSSALARPRAAPARGATKPNAMRKRRAARTVGLVGASWPNRAADETPEVGTPEVGRGGDGRGACGGQEAQRKVFRVEQAVAAIRTCRRSPRSARRSVLYILSLIGFSR